MSVERVSTNWRMGPQRLKLTGWKCTECGEISLEKKPCERPKTEPLQKISNVSGLNLGPNK